MKCLFLCPPPLLTAANSPSPHTPLLCYPALLATAPAEDLKLHLHVLCLTLGLYVGPAALPVPFTLGSAHRAERPEALGGVLDLVPH